MLFQIDRNFPSAGNRLHWNLDAQILCLKSSFCVWIYEIVWHRQKNVKILHIAIQWPKDWPVTAVQTCRHPTPSVVTAGLRCGLVTGPLFNNPAGQVGIWPGGNSVSAQLCFSLGTALLEYASCATNLFSFLPMFSSTFFSNFAW